MPNITLDQISRTRQAIQPENREGDNFWTLKCACGHLDKIPYELALDLIRKNRSVYCSVCSKGMAKK